MYVGSPTRDVPEARGGRLGPVPRTVVLLGVVSMLTDVASEGVNAVLPLYLTVVVGLSPLGYGLVDGLYQGAGVVVRLLGGWVADRTGRPKWVATGGYVAGAVGRALLLPAAGIGAVMTAITVDRLGKGLRTAPRDAMISTSTTTEDQGRAFGVHRALDTIGAVLGPLLAFGVLATLPAAAGGYSAVFVVCSAVAVVAIAVLVLFVPDVQLLTPSPSSSPHERHSRPTGSDERAVRASRWRPLGAVAGAAGLLGFATVGDGFLFLQLAARDETAARAFPLLLVAMSVVFLVLARPVGRLADRFGRTRVFLLGHLALPVVYVTIAGPFAGAAATACCIVLMGAFYAATDGVLPAVAGMLAPPARCGAAIAGAQSAVAVGRACAALTFGLAWSAWSSTAALLLFATLVGVALPAAALLLRRIAG